jgi:hypothetical protein
MYRFMKASSKVRIGSKIRPPPLLNMNGKINAD